MKAELDVFVSTSGLRLVKLDGKVLGSFPLQRIQEWAITAPGTFTLSVVSGEKVVGLVIHGDQDEVFGIIDCLERQVAQIMEDMAAKEQGREAADVSSPPRKMAPDPEDDVRDEEFQVADSVPEASRPNELARRAFATGDMKPDEISDGDMRQELPDELPEELPETRSGDLTQPASHSEFEDQVVPFRVDSFGEADTKWVRHDTKKNEVDDAKNTGDHQVTAFDSSDKEIATLTRSVGGEDAYDDDFDAVSISDDDDAEFDDFGEPRNTPSSTSSSPNETETNTTTASVPDPAPATRPSPGPGHSPESRMAATIAAAAAQELGELKSKLRDAEHAVEAQRRRAETAETAAAAARCVAAAAHDTAGIEEALEEKLADVTERAETAARAAAAAERAASTLETKLAQANERAAAAESNFTQLSDAVVKRDADIARLRAASTAREAGDKGDTAATEALAARVEHARAETSQAEQRAGEAEARSADAEARAEQADTRAEEAEAKSLDLASSVSDLEARLVEAESRVTEAKTEAAALHGRVREANALEAKLVETESLVSESAAEVVTLRASLDEEKTRATDLETKMEESNKNREAETQTRHAAESAASAALLVATTRAETAEAAASHFETALAIATETAKTAAVPEAFSGKTSAVEIACLVDELRGKTSVAEAELVAARAAAAAATTRAENADKRAEDAENLAQQVESAATTALERADAAEAETRARDETLAQVLLKQKHVAHGDMKEVALAEAQRASAAETRVFTLEKRLDALAAARAEVSGKLASALAELAEARGEADASRETLDDAFASARAAAKREGDARAAQAAAEARIAEASDEAASWSERASEADDLRVRCVAAETRLLSAAREGARGVAKAREETERWRAEAGELKQALEDAETRAETFARRAARVDAAVASSASAYASGADEMRFETPSEAATPHSFVKPSLAERAKAELSAYQPPPPMPPSLGDWRTGRENRPGAGAGYAATYHASSPAVLNKTPTPTKLTAEFLDSLGQRLSSVRDMLTAPDR